MLPLFLSFFEAELTLLLPDLVSVWLFISEGTFPSLQV